MLKPSLACVALVLCGSVAFGQEASAPPATPSIPATGASSVLTPSAPLETPAVDAITSPATTTPTEEAAEQPGFQEIAPEEEGFSLPGGYGYAPLNFVPGQGRFDRQPLSFYTTIQQGYDDNIYGSSGEKGDQPVKGSLLTIATQGVDLLVSQSRLGLSFQGNAGAQYYWDREGDKLTPHGSLGLVFAYKLTPRAQLSAVVNGYYTTQPNVSIVSGITPSRGNGYFSLNSKFDFLYRWTQRFSTDTTYTAVGTFYNGGDEAVSDYITNTVGQSLRYLISQRVTGVGEVRAAQTTYSNQSQFDSKTYFYLAGCDVTVTRRLSGSFRAGGTTLDRDNGTDRDNEDSSNSSSPYFEASLDYQLTRISSVALNARHGFNNGGAGNQGNKTTRVGAVYQHSFTPKLTGSLSANYDNDEGSNNSRNRNNDGQDAIHATAAVNYALSQKLSVFANASRFEVFNTAPLLESSRNTYYLGGTYRY